MIIGVPKEIKNNENRIALTPGGALELTKRGHKVYIQKNGGSGSGFSDEMYIKCGAQILDTIEEVYNIARQFFINQIIEKAPHYRRLHRIKPGITSWGQVKYGYAENVDEMVERLQYDLLYLENISIILDLKILIYTVLIMFQGRGK